MASITYLFDLLKNHYSIKYKGEVFFRCTKFYDIHGILVYSKKKSINQSKEIELINYFIKHYSDTYVNSDDLELFACFPKFFTKFIKNDNIYDIMCYHRPNDEIKRIISKYFFKKINNITNIDILNKKKILLKNHPIKSKNLYEGNILELYSDKVVKIEENSISKYNNLLNNKENLHCIKNFNLQKFDKQMKPLKKELDKNLTKFSEEFDTKYSLKNTLCIEKSKSALKDEKIKINMNFETNKNNNPLFTAMTTTQSGLSKRPPKADFSNQKNIIRWVRMKKPENSIFDSLPIFDVSITDEELMTCEKKSITLNTQKEIKILLPKKKYDPISIAFHRIKETDEEIINQVFLNNGANEVLIKTLHKYYPSQEEFELIEKEINFLETIDLKKSSDYTGVEEIENKIRNLKLNNSHFSRVERFFKKIYERREEFYKHLEIIKTLFYLGDSKLEVNIDLLLLYFKSIINSIALKYLIKILLNIGSRYNKLETKAFKLSSIIEFTRIKNNKNKTFLEVAFDNLKELNLLDDLKNDLSKSEPIKNLNTDELSLEIKEIKENPCEEEEVKIKKEYLIRKYDEFRKEENIFYQYLGELNDKGLKILYKELNEYLLKE